MVIKKIPFNIGIHPINWVGEDVKEHGDSYTYDQVMHEISSLGFSGTEVSRKFPKDPSDLQKALDKHNLQLTTQWKSVHFSDPNRHDEEIEAYKKHVNFLKLFGCKVVSTAEIGGSILNQDRNRKEDEIFVNRLDEDGWKYFIEGIHKAGEVCKDNDMQLVYHHHAGTVVEQPEEIDRFMEMTDPNLVSMLYDTGHAYYGNNNPVKLLEKYFNRIKYIHLKDVRQYVLDKSREKQYPIRKSLREGIFTVPGSGSLNFEPIFRALIEKNYNGWALIEGEQDPTVYNPHEYAARSLKYLQKIADKVTEN